MGEKRMVPLHVSGLYSCPLQRMPPTVIMGAKKASTLIGHTFTLTVTDVSGESRSTIDVEVIG